jgi:hypothetical protein
LLLPNWVAGFPAWSALVFGRISVMLEFRRQLPRIHQSDRPHLPRIF